MVLLGWALALFVCVCTHTATATTRQITAPIIPQPSYTTQHQSTTPHTTKTTSDFDIHKALLAKIRNLDYATSTGITLELPEFLNKEITITWDFKGAGDMYCPLPSLRVALQKRQKNVFEPVGMPNIQDLATNFITHQLLSLDEVQDVTNNIRKLYSNPLNLFFIKMALLAKSHYNNSAYCANEASKLFFRLTLSDTHGLIKPGTKLTTYLPASLSEACNFWAPDTLPLIDALWDAYTNPQAHDLTPGKAVVVIKTINFKNSTYAEAAFKGLAQYTGNDFTEAFEDFCDEHYAPNELCQTTTPADFDKLQAGSANPYTKSLFCYQDYYLNGNTTVPAEIRAAAAAVTQYPAVRLVKLANGDTAVCYINNTLDMTCAFQSSAVAIIIAFKEFVQTRTLYFKKNPVEARKHLEAQEDQAKQQLRINEFLKTAQGKASVERLTKALDALTVVPNETATMPNHVASAANNRSHLEQMVAVLKKELASKKNTLSYLLQCVSTIDVRKKIEACEIQINKLIADIQDKTDQLSIIMTQENQQARQQAVPHEIIDSLSNELAEKLRIRGALDELPVDLQTAMPVELPQATDQFIAINDKLALAKEVIAAYTNEIEALKTAVAIMQAEHDVLMASKPAAVAEHESYSFKLIERADAETFIQSLIDHVALMTSKVDQFTEAMGYYTRFGARQADIPHDIFIKIKKLLITVAPLMNAQDRASFISALRSQNNEMAFFLHELMNNTVYSHVKEALLAKLGLVIQKSSWLSPYLDPLEAMIAITMPAYHGAFTQLSSAIEVNA
jgi:hypothetical protein